MDVIKCFKTKEEAIKRAKRIKDYKAIVIPYVTFRLTFNFIIQCNGNLYLRTNNKVK